MPDPQWTVCGLDPTDGVARTLLRAYFIDIVGRYHRRPATADEVDTVLHEEPSDDLRAPTGVFLVGVHQSRPAGCVGLRWCAGYAELTRMFVAPVARGRGGGAALLAEAARRARTAGFDRIRLDTRDDLVEARALYARHGYRPIPAYTHGPYAQHWLEKTLPS